MDQFLALINKSFGVYNIRGIYVEPTYWQAAAIVFLIFLLLFTFARVRWLYVHWNLGKSAMSMLFWGFILALIVEGFLILGGRTLFTEILGWKNAPKPISTLLDISREKMIGVMGVKDEIPESFAQEPPTIQNLIGDFEELSQEDKEMVKNSICKP